MTTSPYITPRYGWRTPEYDDSDYYTEFCSMLSTMEQDVYAISMSGTAIVREGSGYWNSTHSTVSANSASWATAGGDGSVTIMPWAYSSIGQGTWAITLGATYPYQTAFYNSSNTNGDNISYKVHLNSGTYTLMMLASRAVTRGILDIDLDGSQIASFDMYGAADDDHTWSQTGISIASTGLKTLTLTIDGRNGSSTGYYCYCVMISLYRTA